MREIDSLHSSERSIPTFAFHDGAKRAPESVLSLRLRRESQEFCKSSVCLVQIGLAVATVARVGGWSF